MSLGMRVLRGPDWDQNEADGGEGHLGTLVEVKAEEGTAEVVWDNGQVTTCRIGKEGKHDLRILDNAQAGVKHTAITCNGCQSSPLFGTRWRCSSCPNYDLCTVCYITDVHDLAHPFDRFTDESSAGVRVAARQDSGKVRLVGIFPGARVALGWDGESDELDGVGTVVEVVSPESGSARNAVRVSWDSGQSLQHRLGLHGKVDLVCVNEEPGPFCYITHLPLLTVDEQMEPATPGGDGADIKVGDSVIVDENEDVFKDIQKYTCGWSTGMTKYIGRIGKVTAITAKGDADVQFANIKWRICPAVLKKTINVNIGDTVRISADETHVRKLQASYGEWNAILAQSLGRVGRVETILLGGGLRVSFGVPSWVYNPLCCQPAPGCPVDKIPMDPCSVAEIVQKTTEEAMQKREQHTSSELKLRQMREAYDQATRGGVLYAITTGQVDKVRAFLDKDPHMVHSEQDGASLLHIASEEGQCDMVRLLLEKGADMNKGDNDGDTPLILACSKGHEDAVRTLLEAGADPDLCNFKCRTALHKAAVRHIASLCRLLVHHNASPNFQDTAGDTALMDALHKRDDVDTVRALLASPQLDLRVNNNRGYDAFRFCALNNTPRSMELILARDKALVEDCSEEKKWTALHVASVNDHTDVIQFLHEAGANVNAVTRKSQTALHMAAEEVYIESTMLLVQYGVKVNALDSDGNTALHIALADGTDSERAMTGRRSVEERERLQVANFLIQHGTRLDLRNSDGKTPLQVPSDSLRGKVEAFMRDSGISIEGSSRDTQATNETPAKESERSTKLTPKCTQCSQAEAGVIFLPCAHKVTCFRCGPSVARCPVCGVEVKVKVDTKGGPVK